VTSCSQNPGRSSGFRLLTKVFGPFVQTWTSASTQLPAPLRLRGLDVRELVVCGVVTNLCVESTVRSAFMRDFPMTLLADCCAAKTRRLHELSIEVLTSYELAGIANISEGYDVGLDRTPVSA